MLQSTGSQRVGLDWKTEQQRSLRMPGPAAQRSSERKADEAGLRQVSGEDGVISGGDACLGLELWLPGSRSSSHPSPCYNLSQDQGNLRKLHKAVEMGVLLEEEVTHLTWVLLPSYLVLAWT